MAKLACLVTIGLWVSPAAAAAQAPSAAEPSLAKALVAEQPRSAHRCTSSDPTEVVVCGRSASKYRIDPVVLAASRAADAPPPKPELDATRPSGCVGPNCGGGTIPLVGMALTALKAAELAAAGDDWRDAFRTHPDSYSVYQDAKAKQPGPSISIGVMARNK